MSDRLRATRSTLRPGEAPAETRGAEGLLPIAKGETSRRAFLASAGALGVAAVAAPDATGAEAGQAAEARPAMPTNVLGRTGMAVSRLAFGGSWNIDAEVIGAGLELGV